MSLKELETHRIGIYAMYFKIAHDACEQLQVSADEYVSLETQAIEGADELRPITDRMAECYLEQRKQAAICITFCGMSLEAFLYDYAANVLGDAFVKDHLDKLDLKAKFLVYPRLVCGHAPDKSTSAYGSLHRLVKLRNELVHFKSKQFPYTELDKASEHISDLDERVISGAHDTIECVYKVIRELDALHGQEAYFLNRIQSLIIPVPSSTLD